MGNEIECRSMHKVRRMMGNLETDAYLEEEIFSTIIYSVLPGDLPAERVQTAVEFEVAG